jgi:3-phosphoshikimate 1-carboxyvinyltransferase
MEVLVKPIKALHGEIRLPEGEWNALCAMAGILAAASYARSDLAIQGLVLDEKGRRLLQVFRWMDAKIQTEKHRAEPGREPTATLRARGSDLKPTKIAGDTASLFLREIPLWAVAGAFSSGEMVIRDVASLREGGWDGIDGLVNALRGMGVRVGEMPDGLVVDGGRRPQGQAVDAGSDGPLALALSLLGMRAEGETIIHNADGLGEIWPGFVEEMEARAARTRHEVPA